jgi:hypothetical protein
MPLVENDNVIKAFPPDRTDHAFSICVLPRGARRRRSIANAHRSNSSYKNIAVSPIPIADQILGNRAQRKPADWLGGNRYLSGAIPMTGFALLAGLPTALLGSQHQGQKASLCLS